MTAREGDPTVTLSAAPLQLAFDREHARRAPDSCARTVARCCWFGEACSDKKLFTQNYYIICMEY
jgi:hypothetical protein